MSEKLDRIIENNYSKPLVCEKCGSRKIDYKGVGEYACSQCGFFMYDDYGIVRNYLERNPGATQTEVSRDTGISKSKIRQLLKDDKIEIAEGSLVFMTCEKCGAGIRSGYLCNNCKAEELKNSVSKKVSNITGGFSKSKSDTSGAKRFNR